MKYHKFKRLVEANPWLMIILAPYIKGFRREDFGRLRTITGARVREFARNQLKFIAFRPKPTDLKDFLGIMGGQSSRFIEERWTRGNVPERIPEAKEVSFGWRTEFFSVLTYRIPTRWSAFGLTSLPKKDGLGPNAVIDVVKNLEQRVPGSVVCLVARHCVVNIGSIQEVSVELYLLDMSAQDCLQKCNGWFGIKAA